MPRLKLISDGTPTGTSVIDIDTGREIEGVSFVRWLCDGNVGTCQLNMVVGGVPCEITKAEACIKAIPDIPLPPISPHHSERVSKPEEPIVPPGPKKPG